MAHAYRRTRKIKRGDRTPWGAADNSKELGDGVYEVSTPGHGGIYMGAEARAAIPADVRSTFRNGGAWAEEDCEMAIALALLEAQGKLRPEELWMTVDRLRKLALETAMRYESYRSAVPHLQKLIDNSPAATASEASAGEATEDGAAT